MLPNMRTAIVAADSSVFTVARYGCLVASLASRGERDDVMPCVKVGRGQFEQLQREGGEGTWTRHEQLLGRAVLIY